MKEGLFWYWIANIEGIGNVTRRKLLAQFQSPKNIWNVEEKALKKILSNRQMDSLLQSKNVEKIEQSYEKLEKNQVKFLYPNHQSYPNKLKELADPPIGLYLRGKLSAQPLVAIVGTRKASTYGMQMARYFSSELAKAGFGIVSGLAAGIDAISHRTALDSHQYTLGVLGGGIDTMYPRNNFSLYLEMYEKGGVLSEYNRGVSNQAGLFPERNRIISGLADAVLIVEAAQRSGSLITADHALEQGKDIYVIPGRITDPLSVGCNQLIKQGAQPVQSPREIIEDLQEKFQLQRQAEKKLYSIEEKNIKMNLEEKRIYEALQCGDAKTAGMLSRELNIEVNRILSALLNLEINGYIFRDEMQQYMRRL